MKKWLPSIVGAELKKLAVLGGLLVLAGGAYWINREPETPPAAPLASPRPAIPQVPVPSPRVPPSSPVPTRRAAANAARAIDDFRPTLKLPEGANVSQIDPALKVELLAKVRTADAPSPGRSLFEFAQAPAPPPPKVKDIVPAAPKPVEALNPPPGVTESPKSPPPPPITLKYYGFAGTPQGGQRKAFFLDGDEIFVAGENDLVRSRYRIVRIGVNSAVVEDTVNKNQQTLPLVEESPA
jgi:hypothetical protein